MQLAARAEDQVVLRVEADHGDLVVQVAADGGEDRLEDARVEEEGRPEVEAEAVAPERRGPPADVRLALEDA